MANPHEISKRFKQLPPNMKLLNKLYNKNQKDYIRKRFKAIKWLWEGKSGQEVIKKLDINRNSLTSWLKILIEYGVEEGLKQLAKPKTAKKTGKLSKEQQTNLLEILENKKPTDYGYEQNIFTGNILVELVEKLWQIKLTTQSIYNILHRNEFSYQKGHRDYDNADPELQQSYAKTLKKTLENKADDEKIVFFDEFSVTNRPTTFYGWARVNTKFSVPSNEKKKRDRLNGLLVVDAHSGQEYIKLTPKAKTEDLVDYFYDLALQTKREGFNQLTIILDNNSTHKDKMRYNLWLKSKANPELLDFRFNYLNTPTYSPNFNLAEYIIHLIRLNLLHHLPADVTLLHIKNKISNFFLLNQLQTPLQILNTINHILKLGGLNCLL